MKRHRLNIAIIGAGKVGSVLGRILVEEDQDVVCVVSRTITSARAAGKFIGCPVVSVHLQDIPPDTASHHDHDTPRCGRGGCAKPRWP